MSPHHAAIIMSTNAATAAAPLPSLFFLTFFVACASFPGALELLHALREQVSGALSGEHEAATRDFFYTTNTYLFGRWRVVPAPHCDAAATAGKVWVDGDAATGASKATAKSPGQKLVLLGANERTN